MDFTVSQEKEIPFTDVLRCVSLNLLSGWVEDILKIKKKQVGRGAPTDGSDGSPEETNQVRKTETTSKGGKLVRLLATNHQESASHAHVAIAALSIALSKMKRGPKHPCAAVKDPTLAAAYFFKQDGEGQTHG